MRNLANSGVPIYEILCRNNFIINDRMKHATYSTNQFVSPTPASLVKIYNLRFEMRSSTYKARRTKLRA